MDMRPAQHQSLEDKVRALAADLERTQRELRRLERQRKHALHATRFLNLSGLLVIVLLLSLTLSSNSAAQQQTAQPSAIVTHFDVPVRFTDKAGHTVAEISDQHGSYGLTIYGPNGGGVYLGINKQQNGLIQLLGPGNKEITTISEKGYSLNGKSGQAVAFVGASSGGNGMLQLGNASGDSLVEAGALDASTGVVRVYPMDGRSPIPVPNFIKGAAKK